MPAVICDMRRRHAAQNDAGRSPSAFAGSLASVQGLGPQKVADVRRLGVSALCCGLTGLAGMCWSAHSPAMRQVPNLGSEPFGQSPLRSSTCQLLRASKCGVDSRQIPELSSIAYENTPIARMGKRRVGKPVSIEIGRLDVMG